MPLTTFVERHSEFNRRASSDTLSDFRANSKLEECRKAHYALPAPTVVTVPFGALGIAWSNSGNRLTRSLTRFDLASSKMTRNIEFG
jgi:hypothetical protein